MDADIRVRPPYACICQVHLLRSHSGSCSDQHPLVQVSLMDEAGNTKDDLSLPKGTDDAEKLAQQIQEDFDAGKELVVTVLKVCSSTLLMLNHRKVSWTKSVQSGKSPHFID